MADDTDFLALYAELGLAPGINDLDVLKQAYRRRVSQLHPDRQGAEGDPGRLQRLNRMYGAAIAFEQRYGRLPAASVASRRPEPSARAEATVQPRNAGGHERRVQPRPRQAMPPRRNLARYYFALAVLLALAFAVWGFGVAAR